MHDEFETYHRIFKQLEPKRRAYLYSNMKGMLNKKIYRAWYIPALCLVLSAVILLAVMFSPASTQSGQFFYDTLWACMLGCILAYTVAARIGAIHYVPKEPLRSVVLTEIFAIIGIGLSTPIVHTSPIASIIFVLTFTLVAMLANALTAIFLTASVTKYLIKSTV